MDTVQDIIRGQHKKQRSLEEKLPEKEKKRKNYNSLNNGFRISQTNKDRDFFFSLFLTGSLPYKCGFQKGYA